MERRQFVVGIGAVGSIGLAGCIGGGDGGSPEDNIETGSPDAVVESWRRHSATTGFDNLEALAEAAYHSESPELENYRGINESEGQRTDDVQVKNVEASVTQEGLSESALQEKLGIVGGFDDETLAQIASEAETALVEVEITTSLEGFDESETTTEEYAVATEDGEWQLLMKVPSLGS